MELTKKDLEFTHQELDYISDMAGFYSETHGIEENEAWIYRAIEMKCKERMKKLVRV